MPCHLMAVAPRTKRDPKRRRAWLPFRRAKEKTRKEREAQAQRKGKENVDEAKRAKTRRQRKVAPVPPTAPPIPALARLLLPPLLVVLLLLHPVTSLPALATFTIARRGALNQSAREARSASSSTRRLARKNSRIFGPPFVSLLSLPLGPPNPKRKRGQSLVAEDKRS